MSWRIANECAERRFGSPSRKQIIMFLADKASDDGSGIWCSKGTIQRHTELGESTVKRVISDFLREGILVETGRRPCRNGYTVVYRIMIDRIRTLESIGEPELDTGSTMDPVQPGPGTGSTVDGVRGPQWTPNHPKTIHKPPTRTREAAEEDIEDLESEKILAAYPEDRLRDQRSCLKLIREAIDDGALPQDLCLAVQSYAAETAGYTRAKVSFSDNWFKMRRWAPRLETIHADREKSTNAAAENQTRLVGWIADRHPLCRHITARQTRELLAARLVTATQVAEAGISI